MADGPPEKTTRIPSPSRKEGRIWRPAARPAGILLALILSLASLGWILVALPSRQSIDQSSSPQPQQVERLAPDTIAGMESAAFHYSSGWTVGPFGADPAEPADPWTQPAGVVEFEYSGYELALLLALGDYWAYTFVTVDGRPANRLAALPGNLNSLGEPAGYRPLYAPELSAADGALLPQWLTVHRAATSGPHAVRVEIWRGWGQIPLRAVAVDALPRAPVPLWPGVLLAAAALWLAIRPVSRQLALASSWPPRQTIPAGLPQPTLLPLSATATLLVAIGTAAGQWPLSLAGLALLGVVAWHRPALWGAAILFGLPAYLYPLPLLPGRALNLIEVGVWGGLALLAARRLLRPAGGQVGEKWHPSRSSDRLSIVLGLLVSLSLISTFAAPHFGVALREWRTVFLAAGAFWLFLLAVLVDSPTPRQDRWLLVGAWLAGGTAVALVSLWQYGSGQMLITAEGVHRVRALYGSPNNLALYLERTVAVTLALALFATHRARWAGAALSLPQIGALLLTFSKGAILLGLPATLATLGIAGSLFTHPRDRSRRPLLWLAGLAVLVAVILAPFLDTERFRRLLDFSQGTTGFLRLHLWRSALQMALDHPLLGVGPDNFLYAYRSGYILPAAWQEPNLNHPHNWLLDWWTRLGVPGLSLALAFFGLGIGRLWKGLRRGDAGLMSRPTYGEELVLNLGLAAAVAAALAHGLIDASYALPDLMLVWVFLFAVSDEGRTLS